jgi:hypothetical protein
MTKHKLTDSIVRINPAVPRRAATSGAQTSVKELHNLSRDAVLHANPAAKW